MGRVLIFGFCGLCAAIGVLPALLAIDEGRAILPSVVGGALSGLFAGGLRCWWFTSSNAGYVLFPNEWLLSGVR